MYRLYYSPGTASFAVHWALIELGVDYELEHVDFDTEQQRSPAYLAINPLGKVPTLIVDGRPRAETAALLMLLAERHPEPELAPAPGSDRRPEFLQSLFYLANTLMPAFRAWFYPQDFGDPSRSEEIKANARSRIEAALAHVDSLLDDGRRFLIGESFTAADMLFTMLARWARNMPNPAESWPNIKRYLDHMKQRPALRETHARERLADWIDG